MGKIKSMIFIIGQKKRLKIFLMNERVSDQPKVLMIRSPGWIFITQ